MNIFWLCLTAAVFSYTANVFAQQNTSNNHILICTPEWPNYTEKNGTGLYHELWRLIYADAGISVRVQYAPFKRCDYNVSEDTDSDVDAFAAGYAVPDAVIPKWHLGIEHVSVAYQKTENITWQGQKTLENKRVAWENGYKFDKYGVVTVPVKLFEYYHLESALKMLTQDRLDFILDYNNILPKVAEEHGLTDEIAILVDVIQGPKYYMVYRDSEKGRFFADLWDKGMSKLHATGQLKQLYQRYEDASY
ncbi:amino acid ABC transporter periplasmic protein [Oleiphilus messinensis]|uniref:Amino acid ABC transporter periplasmic protein n=1 Tax=Oleiphilus messinensis TaxID=141451 RepID=A0A1Y0I6W0_9GAMM|nr:transporter substrate-binding domain-containing protein [Oleiphilus messinensis]ARU56237.1 amino acid ABC transporter periplasmic protein [Oleiphilus messinensis]